jgi:hypothetical protein
MGSVERSVVPTPLRANACIPQPCAEGRMPAYEPDEDDDLPDDPAGGGLSPDDEPDDDTDDWILDLTSPLWDEPIEDDDDSEDETDGEAGG